MLEIENTSPGEVRKLGSRWSLFRIAKDEPGMPIQWNTYQPCGIHATLPPPSWLKLPPGQVFTDFLLLHIGLDNEPVFNEPGHYFIQSGTLFGESNIVTIEVEGDETVAAAVRFLRDSGLYVLFSDYSAKSMVTLRERAEALSVALDGFREMSKGTPYKTWLPVCEFILEEICSGIDSDHHPLDGEDSARYLRIAEGLPSPQRGHLISSIAMAQMEQGNVKDAQAAYSLLAASTDNGYFRQLALYQLASIRNMTKPK
ncbi:MAG: hypothetical protein ILM98_13565 [Kiritimatiellae bacterium]|nr:hypothetical protein [Kiritimatiellia bacterium]